MSLRSVAVFGGSFDPPHNAHIEIVKEVLRSLDVDRVLIFPSFLNPFKRSFSSPPKLRLEWVRKIFSEFDRVVVDSFEIDRGEPTPSYITIEYVKKRFSPEKIYLIVGADNFLTLKKWANYSELCKSVEFVVAKRGGVVIPPSYKTLDIDNPISSTKIRDGEYLDRVPDSIKKEVEERYRFEKKS